MCKNTSQLVQFMSWSLFNHASLVTTCSCSKAMESHYTIDALERALVVARFAMLIMYSVEASLT
jgi:hypothetical protein